MIIAGKPLPNPETGEVEFFLSDFRQMLRSRGRFVYAWDFNPDQKAIDALRANLPSVWIYLVGEEKRSHLRMRIMVPVAQIYGEIVAWKG